MYKLILVTANIKSQVWYQRMNTKKPFYTFATIDELINFMLQNIPMCNRDIEFIRNNDLKQQNGNLANTSWYRVHKGEDVMTEYTSF